MKLESRVRRRVWWLRSGQSLLAGVAGGVGFGLLAAAEGRAPLPLAICGAVLLASLVLAVSKPWLPAAAAVDPQRDEDGLLRTVLSADLSPEAAAKLELEAGHRPLPLRKLSDWPAWGVLLALVSGSAGWVLLEPEGAASRLPLAQGELAGLGLDGRPAEQSALSALPEQIDDTDSGSEPEGIDHSEDGSEQGQWQRAMAADDVPALRLSLDLGIEQRVYDRYLQNRAKNP